MTTTDPRIEATARAWAIHDEIDGCFERVDAWGALEDWEREAYPDEYPSSDYEDCVTYRKRATAALTAADAVDTFRQPGTTTEWGVQGTEKQGIEAAPSELDARAAVAYLTEAGEVASLVARQITPWKPAS